jgi:hypothetical protein
MEVKCRYNPPGYGSLPKKEKKMDTLYQQYLWGRGYCINLPEYFLQLPSEQLAGLPD